MRGYDWDEFAPQGGNRAAPMGHTTAPNDAQANGSLYSSSAGTNNYNNRFNNDDDNRLIFRERGKFGSSTTSKTLAHPRPAPWPDFSQPPPTRPPTQQVTVTRCKPHYTTPLSPPPSNGHSPSPASAASASAAPNGDKSISGLSWMTSSKVHEDETRSHWDQNPVGNSDWFTIAHLEDETSKTAAEGQRSTTTAASFPVDEDSDAMPDFTWDIYELRREDQRREDQRREDQRREDQRREDQRREDQRRREDDEVYDPENPTNAGDEIPTATNPKPEGLSESELLCFLRLLKDNDSSNIRYTIEQFVTCIPVTIDVETQRQRFSSMSSAGVEIYNSLQHLAPKATRPQVLNSMVLLPFILKSLGETALQGTDKRRKTPPEDESRSRSRSRSRPRSRPRSNPPSSSLHRRNCRRRAKSPPPPLHPPPEVRRPGCRSPIRRSPPNSSGLRRRGRRSPKKTRSGSDAPEWKELAIARRDRRDVLTKQQQQQPRPSSGKATVRLDHLEIKEEEEEEAQEKDGEEATASESRAPDETEWRVLRFRKRPRKSVGGQAAGSTRGHYVRPNRSGQIKTPSIRLPPPPPLRRGFRPPISFFRMKSGEPKPPIRRKIHPLLDIDFRVPRFPRDRFFPVPGESATRHSLPAGSNSGREPPVGRGPSGGLLPDPGTIEYRAVIQRSVTTRLGSRSPRPMNAQPEFTHSTRGLHHINNGKM